MLKGYLRPPANIRGMLLSMRGPSVAGLVVTCLLAGTLSCGQRTGIHPATRPAPGPVVAAAPEEPQQQPTRRPDKRPARQAPPAQGSAPAGSTRPATRTWGGIPTPTLSGLAHRRCQPVDGSAPAPLTGGRYDVNSGPNQPVLAVKIENSSHARPQTGLEAADVVIEHVAEGGITRLTALYHSCVPEIVGPVRSARPVDAQLLPAFAPALVYSGARPGVIRRLRRAGVPTLVEGEAQGFFRYSGRRAPHNLYIRAPALHRAARSKAPPAADPGWARDPAAPNGKRTDGLTVRMSRADVATWRYDADAGVYDRWQNGQPHGVTGRGRISPANVVILRVPHRDGGCCDSAGSRYVDIDTVGQGPMTLLRDGVRVDGRWRRDRRAAPLQLLDGDRQPVALRPGRTWIMLAPR